MNKQDVAEIFRIGFEDYVKSSVPLPDNYLKVAHDIQSCRTEELGGHVDQCDKCEEERIRYNSCCNRHCPQCQTLARVKWVNQRIEELLPVPYFHAVFTLPNELNPFFLRNKKACYSLLFDAVKETLAALSADSKFLGARTGFILVLHTWGQNLMDHPHMHCIVPGGGVDIDGKWKDCKGKFLFPVRVMAALFRGKLLDAFKSGIKDKTIEFHGSLGEYEAPGKFQKLLDELYRKKWVAYVKEPFASPQAVVRYLGNYTHRIAISNNRILSIQDGRVSFLWKDYADHSKKKVMTLPITEFIRRFLLHVVPHGFMRIRHYGILGNRCKAGMLELCRMLLLEQSAKKAEQISVCEDDKKEKKKWHEVIQALTGKDPRICPFCGKGLMMEVREIPKRKRTRSLMDDSVELRN
jgi:hypothetical protein